MPTRGYIVIRGGRPCGLVKVPKLKADVLLPAKTPTLFVEPGEAGKAIARTLRATSQLRGAHAAANTRELKKATVDARLYAVVPARKSP